MIHLTETAAKEVKRVIQDQGLPEDKTKLRASIHGGGCSGFAYKLEFVEETTDLDETSEDFGVKVVVDQKSDLYLNGTTIDFYTGLEKRGFIFNNPNAKNTCGCNQSFSP